MFGTSVHKQAQAQTNKQISLDILHQDLKFNSSLFLAHHRTEQCEQSVKPLVEARHTESVTKLSTSVSQLVVGNSTEIGRVDWPGLGLALLEMGIVEGSLAGKVVLNKPMSERGTYILFGDLA